MEEGLCRTSGWEDRPESVRSKQRSALIEPCVHSDICEML